MTEKERIKLSESIASISTLGVVFGFIMGVWGQELAPIIKTPLLLLIVIGLHWFSYYYMRKFKDEQD